MEQKDLLAQIAQMMEQQTQTLDKKLEQQAQGLRQEMQEMMEQQTQALDKKLEQQTQAFDRKMQQLHFDVAQMMEQQTLEMKVMIENDVTRRLDALTDGYKLNHEKQYELEREIELLKRRVERLENAG